MWFLPFFLLSIFSSCSALSLSHPLLNLSWTPSSVFLIQIFLCRSWPKHIQPVKEPAPKTVWPQSEQSTVSDFIISTLCSMGLFFLSRKPLRGEPFLDIGSFLIISDGLISIGVLGALTNLGSFSLAILLATSIAFAIP